jgi:hypothetical protein
VRKLSYFLVGLITLCLCAMAGQAQQTTKKEKSMKAKAHTITGCLAKGQEADEYTITDANGKVHNLRAESGVDLSAHVGHTVTVTGMRGHETAKEEMKEENKENKEMSKSEGKMKGMKEHYLKVTDVKMVSETCNK